MEHEKRSRQEIEIELHKRLAGEYRKRYSPGYSRIFQEYWNKTILDELGPNNKMVVLDFGCGTAAMTKDLSARCLSAFGVDISFEMLKEAGLDKIGPLKNLVVGNGLRLPFVSGVFDAVVCKGSLHHLDSLNGAIDEIRRVLVPSGILVLSEPSNDSFAIRTARRIMYKTSDKFCEQDEGYMSQEMSGSLVRHGFSIKNIRRFGFLSYLFAGFPDHFDPLNKVPFNRTVTKALVSIDKLLSKIPLVSKQSFHIIIKAQKSC